MRHKIAFIGGGNMASAIVHGLLNSSTCTPQQILISVNSKQSQQRWQQQNISHCYIGPHDDLRKANIWILAVKPQIMQTVIKQYRDFIAHDALVISVAAGLSCKTLANWLGDVDCPWQRLIRTMPNTPSLLGQGVIGAYASKDVMTQNSDLLESLFAPCGQVVFFDDEEMINSLTALAGSGPAYVYLFMEALVAGAIELGFDKKQAQELTLATLKGAISLAQQSTVEISQLRQNVTSKGGTTAAALSVFEQHDFQTIVVKAMQAAVTRSREIGKELG